MKHLVRIACLTVLIAGIVMTSAAADKTLTVLQKFTYENNIGANNGLVFADVNGDGHKDIVAQFVNNSKKSVAGIWLWRGTKFSDSVDCTIDLGLVTEEKLTAGDLNGDGIADLAFLSQYSSTNPPKVVFGRTTWPKTITTADLVCGPVKDSTFEASGQYASMVIADFNADGYGDLCYQIQGNDTAGTYLNGYGGMLAVYFGGAPMDSIADWVYKGAQTYTITGTSNTFIPRWFSPWHMAFGDFNGDGYMDILTSGWNGYTNINEYNFKGNMQTMYNCGAGLIFFGGPDFATSPRPDVILLASDNWLKYTTPAQYLWLGYSVYNAGDVNGDGVDDISLPAWYMDIDLIFAGNKAWHKAAADSTVLFVRNELLSYTKGRFDFASYSDQFGVDVLSIGDVNGDGLGDLAVTRNYFGGYYAENPGMKLFFSKAGKQGPIQPDYETADYIKVMPGSVDVDNDGISEFLAQDANNVLTLLKVNPVFISGVTDVPFDQGGNVRVAFSSTVDNDVSKFPYFSIWRAVPSDGIVQSQIPVVTSITKDYKGHASFSGSIQGLSFGWEWIKNVPAQLQDNYSASVPTLYDSMPGTDGKHYFMVIAHTSDPNKFYTSGIDSGFSVDNLAPAMPAGIAASVVGGYAHLTWNANTETDMKQYVVYKSNVANIPDGAPVYATVVNPEFTDGVALGSSPVYYVVKAQDVHGNLSVKSNEVKISLVSVEISDSEMPTSFSLGQNYPNPFNPTTTIEYALKHAGNVTLRVMNMLGEVVSTLESGYKPAGRYRATFDASRLASGVYLYQIRTPEFVDVKRMILVK